MHSRSCLKMFEIHWVDARKGGQSAYHFQSTMGNWMGGQTAYHFQPTILKSQPTISKPSLPFEIPAYHSRISKIHQVRLLLLVIMHIVVEMMLDNVTKCY